MAVTPTTTITPRSTAGGSRRPIAGADQAAEVGAGRDQAAAAQSMWATKRKRTAATPLTSGASTFLSPFIRCRSSGAAGPSGREQDALGGAEVAAVDAGEEDAGDQRRAAVGRGCRAPPRAATARVSRGWRTTRTSASAISTGTMASNAARQCDQQDGAGDAAEQASRTEPAAAAALALSSRR